MLCANVVSENIPSAAIGDRKFDWAKVRFRSCAAVFGLSDGNVEFVCELIVIYCVEAFDKSSERFKIYFYIK